jgi:hypothetical protein
MTDPDNDEHNPFVRWKRMVDFSLALTLKGLVGLPTVLSSSLRPETQSGSQTASDVLAPPLRRYLWRPCPGPEEDDNELFRARILWQQDHLGPDPGVTEFADFLFNSPYSPCNLREMPQPVPKDLPQHLDPSTFTFSDAFADLLASRHGGSLSDLDAVAWQKNSRERITGSSDLAWPDWLALYHAGLFDHYASHPRRCQPMFGRHNERPAVKWALGSAENGSANNANDGHAAPPAIPKATDYSMAGGLFEELDRVFRILQRVLSEETGGGGQDKEHPESAQALKAETAKREPETEDELYSVLKSAFSEKSLSALFKAISLGASNAEVDAESRPTERRGPPDSTLRKTGDEADEARKVVTKEEHVDVLGNHHVKTVTRHLNEQGEEVGRSTVLQVRSRSRLPRTKTGQQRKVGDDGSSESSSRQEEGAQRLDEARKEGWFWK